MLRKTVSIIMLSLLVVSALALAFDVSARYGGQTRQFTLAFGSSVFVKFFR